MPAEVSEVISKILASRGAPDLASNLVLGSVRRVTVESQFLPAITFEPSLDSSGRPTQPSSFNPLAWIKPKVTVELLAGPPITYAPAGEPSGNYFLHGLGVVVLAAAGLAFVKGAMSIAKPAAIVAGGLVVLGVIRNRS